MGCGDEPAEINSIDYKLGFRIVLFCIQLNKFNKGCPSKSVNCKL